MYESFQQWRDMMTAAMSGESCLARGIPASIPPAIPNLVLASAGTGTVNTYRACRSVLKGAGPALGCHVEGDHSINQRSLSVRLPRGTGQILKRLGCAVLARHVRCSWELYIKKSNGGTQGRIRGPEVGGGGRRGVSVRAKAVLCSFQSG
jgi:hypothetical protein